MGRPVRRRDDYAGDLSTLHRIAAAVKIDDRIAPETREGIVVDLQRAIKKLMAVELGSLKDEAADAAPESGEADGRREAEKHETDETADEDGDAEEEDSVR